jgi:DNA-binding transcriptional LysR family regulator
MQLSGCHRDTYGRDRPAIKPGKRTYFETGQSPKLNFHSQPCFEVALTARSPLKCRRRGHPREERSREECLRHGCPSLSAAWASAMTADSDFPLSTIPAVESLGSRTSCALVLAGVALTVLTTVARTAGRFSRYDFARRIVGLSMMHLLPGGV